MRIIRSVSIYTRFLLFFIISILLLSIAAFAIYNRGFTIINQTITNHNSAISRNLADNLTNEFRRIMALQYDLSNNWNLTKLSMEIGEYNSYELSQIVLEVQDKTEAIKSSSQLIGSISVIIPAIEKTITANTIRSISADEFELLKSYNSSIEVTDKGVMLISEFPHTYNRSEGVPRFVVVGLVGSRDIMHYIASQSLYAEGEGFLYHPASHTIIGNQLTQQQEREIVGALNLSTGNQQVAVNHTTYRVALQPIGIEDLYMVRYVDSKVVFADLNGYRWFIILFFLISLGAVLIFAKVLKEMIHRPLGKLAHAFEDMAQTEDVVTIHHSRNDEFKYIYDSFNQMSERIHTLVEQVLKQELLVSRAELKQLQAQINPHFLYNIFLTLSHRIDMGDNEFATHLSRDIGKFFMYIARNKADVVPLQEEVEHAMLYTNLQYARFSNQIALHIAPLPAEYKSIQVPRLIIQPIIENAFEYVLEQSHGGVLAINYQSQGDILQVIIEDNGTEITIETLETLQHRLDNPEYEVTGMVNIHRRLQLRYGKGQGGITLGKSEYGGLKVTLHIGKNGCLPLGGRAVPANQQSLEEL